MEAARAGALATTLLGSTKAGLWVSLSRSLVEDTETPVKRFDSSLEKSHVLFCPENAVGSPECD